jgi:hypothetical protein
LSTQKKNMFDHWSIWSIASNLIISQTFDPFRLVRWIRHTVLFSTNFMNCVNFDSFCHVRPISSNLVFFPLSILINSVYFDEFLSNRFILSKFHHFLQNYSFSSILISSCQIWSIASNLLDIWSISSIWMNFRQIGSFLSNLIDGVKLDSFVTFSQFHEIWCFFMKFDELRLLRWIFVKLGHFCKFNQFRQTRQFWLIFVTFEQFHQIWSFPRHLIQFVYFDECSVNWPIFVRFDGVKFDSFCHVRPISSNLMIFSSTSINSVYFDEFSSNWVISCEM